MKTVVVSIFVISCASPVGSAKVALLDGPFTLVDVYAHPDPTLRELAENSVGGLFPRRALDEGPRSFGEVVEAQTGAPYCTDAPLRDEPVIADCSGVLIDDDLFLTAAHCVPTQRFCDEYSVAFNNFDEAEGVLRRPGDAIYDCASIAFVSHLRDIAILRLARVVIPPHRPAAVRSGNVPVAPGTSLAVIGHPGGTPTRIDSEGSAGPARDPDGFFLRADLLPGHSGSPVFVDGEVVGVVSRGPEAFVVAECATPSRSDGEARDVAAYASFALYEFCRTGESSLCASDWCPECGGGCSVSRGTTLPVWLVLLWVLRRSRAGHGGFRRLRGSRNRRAGQARTA